MRSRALPGRSPRERLPPPGIGTTAGRNGERSRTVLVVDDRAPGREFLASLLGYAGYRVLEARDGVQALETVRRERPDLVVTDVPLPNMDGIELTRRLHADPVTASLPVVLCTAVDQLDEARALAGPVGAAAVLGKPAEPQRILDTVRALLAPSAVRNGGDPLPLPAAAELLALQKRLQDSLGEGMQALAGEPARPGGRLRQALDGLQTLSTRLAAVLELGLDLAHERDPDRLLQAVCSTARNVVVASYAGLCIDTAGPRPWRFVARGMTADQLAAVRAALQPTAGLLGQVAADGHAQRLRTVPSLDALGLPPSHPPVREMLAVPVESGGAIRGWLYLADKLGAAGFSDEDEQFAATLAAQASAAYENLVLYDQVEKHAEQLEAEIAERKLAVSRLAESERRFRQLAETINEVFFLVAPGRNRLLYLSPAYQRIWGRSGAMLYESLDRWMDDIDPRDRARVEREVLLAIPPGQFDSEFRIRRPDGAERWVRVRGFPIHGPKGELQRIAGVAEDVTERREHEQRIARLTRIYAVLSDINSAIVRIRDRDELMQEACRIAVDEGRFEIAWIGIVGPRHPQVAAGARRTPQGAERHLPSWPTSPRHAANRVLHEARSVIINDLAGEAQLGTGHEPLQCSSMAAFPIRVDGELRGVLTLCAAEAGYFDEQELRLLRELAGDIGFGLQYIGKEEGLRYLAFYDPLTGLANGTLFLDRLRQFVANARLSRERVAVVVLDLERFTQINDSLGRQVGDALLRMVAERLGQAVDEPFSVARISADSFALAIGGLHHRSDAAMLLNEQVLRNIEQPFSVDGSDLLLSARAGIAMYPGDGDDAATLFNNAEAALKRAQLSGERYLYYARQMNAEVAEKLALEARLRRALERRQFCLHYQPKWLADSGELLGFEALARWHDPERGLMLPGAFMALLEETGLILEFGEWALRQALSDYRDWSRRDLQPPRIAVNVSALQLHRPDFADRVLAAIEDCGVGADALELEITETVIMQDVETCIRTLQRLRAAGVCIAIDDFGTGYSSLRYLATLPVDTLKIDRSFVVTMLQDASSQAIVSLVISLARTLELSVIAEGVDADAQADALRTMGCGAMQGFLFGGPLPADEAAGQIGRPPPAGLLGGIRPSTSVLRPAP